MWNRRDTILPAGIERHLIVEAGQDTIINSVLYYFGYTLDELKEKNRKLDVLIPRHYIHYFLTVIDEISFREIGEITGMNHASVIRSREVIEDWVNTDKRFRAQTYAIATLIIKTNMKQKAQIIGKVTGLERAACVEKFKETQDILETFGYEVVNPVVLVPEDATYEDAMRQCLSALLTVDAVAIQPDWHESKGAKVEYMVASALQLKMIMI